MRDSGIVIAAASLLSLAAAARAGVVHIPEPAADRWMYNRNSTPGTRATASTYSYLPHPGEDDRFGQVVWKFDTAAAGIPAGLGAANYDVRRVVLTAIYASEEVVVYDPTEDPRSSYGSGAEEDPDPGRPLELYGTGFRGGFTAATFKENSPFSAAPLLGNRNAYALGGYENGAFRDVTNNVTEGFDSNPWAVATIEAPGEEEGTYAPLAPGEVIPLYSRVTFVVDTTQPGVAEYVREGLNSGFLWFTASSLHPVAGQGGTGFPGYFMKEHPEQQLFHDVASSLDIEYELPLRILSFVRNTAESSVRIDWNGLPGFHYEVQTSSSLAADSWETVAGFTPVSAEVLSWQGAAAAPSAFYRIARSSAP